MKNLIIPSYYSVETKCDDGMPCWPVWAEQRGTCICGGHHDSTNVSRLFSPLAAASRDGSERWCSGRWWMVTVADAAVVSERYRVVSMIALGRGGGEKASSTIWSGSGPGDASFLTCSLRYLQTHVVAAAGDRSRCRNGVCDSGDVHSCQTR
jgi:hypothetical protein